MKKKKSLIGLIKKNGILILLLFSTTLIISTIISNYYIFNIRSEKLREDYNKQQKEIIKNEVFRIINRIDIEVQRSKNAKINDIKIDEKIQRYIAPYLLNYRFGKHKKGYIFILDLININGGEKFSKVLVNPNRPDLVGKFVSDEVKDVKGKQYRKEFLRGLRKNGECYVKYWYKKFDIAEPIPKISFFKLTADKKYIVAAGVYLDDVEAEISKLEKELKSRTTKEISFILLISFISILLFSIFLIIFNRRIQNDFNHFLEFFKIAVNSDKPMDISKLKFSEFDIMAKNANKMLGDKIKAEQNLLMEKERLLVTIRSIGDGVITTDKEGKVVLLNKVAENLTGWKTNEAKGKKLVDIFKIINSKTRKVVENPVKKVLQLGKIVGLANHTVLVSKDGKEYQIADSAAPIKDSEGNILGVVLVFRDVTEEYKMREEVKKKEKYFKSLIENISDAIAIIDINGKSIFRSTSLKKMFGFSEYEVIEKGVFDFIHPDDRERLEKEFMEFINNHNNFKSFNFKGVKKDGSAIYLEGTAKNMLNSPIINGIILNYRDVSKRKRAEEELQKMEKLQSIGTLAGGIAHDFNNIMTGLYGNISLAKMKLPENHKIYKYLNNAEKSMNRAINLTKQLLTFSKGGNPILENVEIDKLLEKVVEFDLSGSNVKPIFNKPDNLWPVEVDEGQVQQVFSNLTINANQAMPKGGHLYIDLQNVEIDNNSLIPLEKGKYIKITFKDEGIGIAPKNLSRIFDPYFTTKETGNGLGMATVFSIIKKHKGWISVESELDKGTTFTIYLPVVETKKIEEKTEEKKLENLKSGNILIMDDEEIICETCSMMLEELGFKSEYCFDGKDAIKIYKDKLSTPDKFDAIIMDLTIPGGMGGKEAVKKILEIDSEAKVIVSSGYSSGPILSNYKELGFKGIIGKPYVIEKLQKVLGELLK